MKRIFLLARGRLRLNFGFCPQCNSDAPKLYDCPVCNWNKRQKALWWFDYKTHNNLH